MTTFDALLVLNQAASRHAVEAACRRSGARRVLAVTTHRLFPDELAALSESFEALEVFAFADLLDDSVMAECDERASAELRARRADPCIARTYARRFAALSTLYKNRALHAALRQRFEWRHCYYAPGLGVAAELWGDELGARRIEGAPVPPRPRCWPAAVHTLVDFGAFVLRPGGLYRLKHGGEEYLFLAVRRLRFRDDARPEPVSFSPGQKLLAALRARSLRPVTILRSRFGADVLLSATIHEYPAFLQQADAPVRIFVDGFHPANYPRTYLDHYGAGEFVVPDPLSTEWFRRFGRTVLPPPAFISVPAMVEPSTGPVRKVLLALNHAGDWTALINRSDTDVLVAGFCDAARRFPELSFTVRPHPTMAIAAHEGEGSRARLERYVRSQSLANLGVSQNSLEADLAAADLVVSEYSQVLIDALANGKLGIIANFTGRRSFMADYEACGFASATNLEELCRLLAVARDEPRELVERQTAAARRYNERLAEWLGGAAERGEGTRPPAAARG